MAANYFAESISKLKEFEGCVPWMYRDTVGKITVGVGLMLPDSKAAQSLPFFFGADLATPEQVAAEFSRVDALPPDHPSNFYKTSVSLELPAQSIDAKLAAVLKSFESDLRARLPHYDTFPDGVKMALLDMIYNLGPEGLFHGFPHLIAAVEAGAWVQAAGQCLRHGPGEARNEWTRRQFLSAVVTSIQAEAEGFLVRFLRRLRLTFGLLFRRNR
jgi:GH24 family phage-related lysozyme (muramidase)